MDYKTMLTASAILAIVGMVLLLVLIMPEKKRAKLPKFWQVVHDVFNFKQLWLEKIFKVLYVFTTLYVFFLGFFMLFGYTAETYSFDYYRGAHYGSMHVNTFPQGLAIMIGGPIVVRIVYEVAMLALLAVKNIIEINKKMPTMIEQKESAAPAAPAAPEYIFCTECGTRYDKSFGRCPNCGKQ